MKGSPPDPRDAAALLPSVGNDLQPPVIRRRPVVQEIIDAAMAAGATMAAMTGSGSAVFGLFRSRAAAARCVRPLSKSGNLAILTRTISRAEYERRARAVAKKR